MPVPEHYNPKAGYKHYTIYHAGPNDYRTIDNRNGEEIAKKPSLSQACRAAKAADDLENADYEWCG